MGTDVNNVNLHKDEKGHSVYDAEAKLQEAEEMILQVGQLVIERSYERFSCGELTTTQMQEIYSTLTQWTALGQRLLKGLE